MLGSNFLESYVTPALPEIVSMHKVRLEFPGNWWPYIFVETKKRLHKFCPCSVYTYTNFNSSLQFPFSFNVLTHKISFCPKSKCKSCPHYRKTRILSISLREKCSYSEFFWSFISRIRTEYGEIVRISPYSVRMRENTDQKHSEHGHVS